MVVYVFCATESDVDLLCIIYMKRQEFFKLFSAYLKSKADINYVHVSDIIYLFIYCLPEIIPM